MSRHEKHLFSGFFRLLWLASMLAAVLSGLAHLPFAFRYGLIQGWRASPTVAHYWSAAALLLLGSYALVVWWRLGRREFALTRCGLARVIFLSILAVSGLLLTLHNLPGFSMYGGTYAFIKLGHLFCALALLPLMLQYLALRLLGRNAWLTPMEKPRHRARL